MSPRRRKTVGAFEWFCIGVVLATAIMFMLCFVVAQQPSLMDERTMRPGVLR